MRMKTRSLLLLAAFGLVLVGWLIFAWGNTDPPSWPVLVADLVAVVGLAVGPWLVLVGRQLVRARDPAAPVYSRVVVVTVALALGGPLGAAVLVLGIGYIRPEMILLVVLPVMAATLVGLVGAGILPWLFLGARTLTRERAARARAEERAAVAAHLHDSVLQALTLILKQADDPPAVRRLARGTERELRAWLYGTPAAAAADLPGAVRSHAEEVEDMFDMTVELVTVGTCPLDQRAQAVVAATREALVNAAKHSGVHRVSVFVEASDGDVFALIRDRGQGFDPTTVPPDRRGIADSIEGRIRRYGGNASVRSSGTGTEVELRMPR